jgi:hypothetical protein
MRSQLKEIYLWASIAMNKLFRNDFKTRKEGQNQLKYDFFQVTAGVVPQSYPTTCNFPLLGGAKCIKAVTSEGMAAC